MELKKMYEATAFSPIASLSKNIGADDTTIYVDNVSVFPAGPGLATIGIDEGAETIRYAAITDAALTGCMRGIEGTAKAWPAGENIARNFTAKDWNDLKENVEALYKEMQDKCVPADWSVNAEDSPSYIKNKPFWKEYVASSTEYLNATLNFKANMANVSGTEFSEIIAGQTYIVFWNGSPYECIAYSANGSVFLGNGTLNYVDNAVDTGEPFCIEFITATAAYVTKSTDKAETITIKITPPGKVIYHKLDKNFLPDDYKPNSSGGGVSSWNDLTDKPFGDMETVLAAEKTFSKDAGTDKFTDLNSTMVHDGQELVVRFDGAKYKCKVKDYGDFFGDGNILIATDNYADYMAGNNELPFCLIFKSTQTNIACSSSGEHTASVYAVETMKIEGKYLPEGLPYTEGGGMVEILPEMQITYDEDMSGFIVKQELSLSVGETYLVRYNGVEYKTVASEQADETGTAIVLGNAGAMTGGDDTGEPFVFAYQPAVFGHMGITGVFITLDGATTLTVGISGHGRIVHKLDPKYLPDNEIEFAMDSGGSLYCKQYSAEELYNSISSLIDKEFVMKMNANGTTNKSKAVYILKNPDYSVIVFLFPSCSINATSGTINKVSVGYTAILCSETGFRFLVA